MPEQTTVTAGEQATAVELCKRRCFESLVFSVALDSKDVLYLGSNLTINYSKKVEMGHPHLEFVAVRPASSLDQVFFKAFELTRPGFDCTSVSR